MNLFGNYSVRSDSHLSYTCLYRFLVVSLFLSFVFRNHFKRNRFSNRFVHRTLLHDSEGAPITSRYPPHSPDRPLFSHAPTEPLGYCEWRGRRLRNARPIRWIIMISIIVVVVSISVSISSSPSPPSSSSSSWSTRRFRASRRRLSIFEHASHTLHCRPTRRYATRCDTTRRDASENAAGPIKMSRGNESADHAVERASRSAENVRPPSLFARCLLVNLLRLSRR